MGCAEKGGCVTDYMAVVCVGVTSLWIAASAAYVYSHREFVPIRAKQVGLMLLQSVASLLWLVSLVFSLDIFSYGQKLRCSIWTLWLGGVFGFGLWMACHVARVARLYFVFVRLRLPPLSSYVLVSLQLIPWALLALIIHLADAVTVNSDGTCRVNSFWFLIWALLYIASILAFITLTYLTRNITYVFNEAPLGFIILVFLGVWFVLFVVDRVMTAEGMVDGTVAVRFLSTVAACITTLLFFWTPLFLPIQSLLQHRNSDLEASRPEPTTPVPPARLLPVELLNSAPLKELLAYPSFVEAFTTFANSRLCGEWVIFYDAAQRRRRLAGGAVILAEAAEEIIKTFVEPGARLELNLSSRMRRDVMSGGRQQLEELGVFEAIEREALRILMQNVEGPFRQSPIFSSLRRFAELEEQAKEQMQLMGVPPSVALEDYYSEPSAPLKGGSALLDGEGTSVLHIPLGHSLSMVEVPGVHGTEGSEPLLRQAGSERGAGSGKESVGRGNVETFSEVGKTMSGSEVVTPNAHRAGAGDADQIKGQSTLDEPLSRERASELGSRR